MVPRTRTDVVAVRIPRRRFTVEKYHRMAEAKAQAIEVYTRPAPRGYRAQTTVGRGRVLSPLAFPRVRLRVNEILG